MKEQPEHPDRGLYPRIPYERVAQPLTDSPNEERADGHPAEEDREHEDLGVGAVADEEREVARPDRLIDEARSARQEEERVERKEHVKKWPLVVGAGSGRCESTLTTARGCTQPTGAPTQVKPIWRSEERRVGKECRSRWSP